MMKTKHLNSLAIPVAAMALMQATIDSAQADILLGGPGLPIGTYNLTQMNDQIEVDLGKYYKYEVYGYYGRLNAGVPYDGWIGTTGQIYSQLTPSDWSGTKQTHTCSIVASVGVGSSAAGDSLELVAGNVLETTGDVVIQRGSLLSFENQNVRLKFQVSSNVTNPTGYLVVMGVGIKQPPKPSGSLAVPVYAEAHTNPSIGWTISRESVAEGQDGYDSTMNIELPTFDTDPSVEDPDSDSPDVDDPVDDGWKGNGKTKTKNNNGHGNNVDGVDVSNPGKGKGGPNGEQDTDYDGDGTYEDDEKKGW